MNQQIPKKRGVKKILFITGAVIVTFLVVVILVVRTLIGMASDALTVDNLASLASKMDDNASKCGGSFTATSSPDIKFQCLGKYYESGETTGIAVSGKYAYTTNSKSSLEIIDVSDTSQPKRIGSFWAPGYVPGVEVRGHYAYTLNYASGLEVFDVSNPTAPTIIATCDTPTPPMENALTISGDFAYVGGAVGGHQTILSVIDISNPASPLIVGSYEEAEFSIYSVAINGNYAYLGAQRPGWWGIKVLDISNPQNPVLVGERKLPGGPRGIAVSGNHAYVSDWDYGFQVLDISNPAEPVIVGSCDTPGAANNVILSSDMAYVADWDGGIQLIDISNPRSPSIAATWKAPQKTYETALYDGNVYVADGMGGMLIVKFSR